MSDQFILNLHFLRKSCLSMVHLNLLIIVTLILVLPIVLIDCAAFPKILWKYWQTDIKTYGLAEMFDEHHRYVLQGWDVRMLNKTSLMTYLNQIPYYANDIDTINFTSVQSKSDYIRVLLLSYYGGVWSDQSTIFVQDLSWLDLQNLRQNPDVLNKHGQKPQILLFSNSGHCPNQICNYSDKNNVSYQVSPGYEIWFMAAQPNSTLLRQFLPQLKLGLYNQMTSYTKGPKYIEPLMQKQHVQLGGLKNFYYLAQLMILQYMIQKKQNQFNRLSLNNGSRQLAVWYYKIWHIKAEKGPFALFFKWGIKQAEIMARLSKQYLQRQYNVTIRYFLKIINDDRTTLEYYYFPFNRGNPTNLQSRTNRAAFMNNRAAELFFCPELYRIYEPSIIYQYLIKNNSHNFNAEIVHESYQPFSVRCSEMRQFVELVKNQYGANGGHWRDRNQSKQVRDEEDEYWEILGEVYDREIELLNSSQLQQLSKHITQPTSTPTPKPITPNPLTPIPTISSPSPSLIHSYTSISMTSQQLSALLIKASMVLLIVVLTMGSITVVGFKRLKKLGNLVIILIRKLYKKLRNKNRSIGQGFAKEMIEVDKSGEQKSNNNNQ